MRNFLTRVLLVFLFLGGGAAFAIFAARAQGSGGALVITTCGTLPLAFTVGSTRSLTVNTNGQVCQ